MAIHVLLETANTIYEEKKKEITKKEGSKLHGSLFYQLYFCIINMPSVSEKRLFRTRSKCPKPLQENLGRANTQGFKILEAPQLDPDWQRVVYTCLVIKGERTEAAIDVDVLGSTGNAYTVSLDFCPTCTCPYFGRQQDICKHIFFVLLKVAGLPSSSRILYQKAYLRHELYEIFTSLSVKISSANILPSPLAQSVRRQRPRLQSICDVCDAPLTSRDVIHCQCGSEFHPDCGMIDDLPDFSRLSLSSRRSPHSCRTRRITCPYCHVGIDHDEGYVNVAHATGQSRIRDTSTYRPCPGYGTYSYSSRRRYR